MVKLKYGVGYFVQMYGDDLFVIRVYKKEGVLAEDWLSSSGRWGSGYSASLGKTGLMAKLTKVQFNMLKNLWQT